MKSENFVALHSILTTKNILRKTLNKIIIFTQVQTDLCFACLMQIICVKYFSENKLNQCTVTLKLILADICKNIHMYPSMCGSIMVSLDCMVIRENALITKT